MRENIARLNVAHFRVKLATERDEAKQQILCRLLAEEEAKLAALRKTVVGPQVSVEHRARPAYEDRRYLVRTAIR